ncbi:DNA alkylation repair protein [Fibrobacteria bacterium R8-3-H12]
MWYDKLFTELEKNKNAEQAIKMAAYMQNKFIFLGIPKPKLKEIIKPYIKEGKKHELDWKFINICWNKNYREAQYVAVEYLDCFIKVLTSNDLPNLKKLIVTKSWWETADAIDAMIGNIILKNIQLEKEMLEWSIDKNLWLRRVSIDFQQKYKEKTNQKLLEQIILNNFGTDDFFINKAIGWSLREYSKTNQKWIKDFINKYKNQLHKLSVKEASKYL